MAAETCKHTYVQSCEMGLCCLACGIVRNPVPKAFTGALEDDYSYEDLDRHAQEIRLVVILPGNFADRLCCRIVIKRLSSLPYYSAISYTWATYEGDAGKDHNIWICSRNKSKVKRTLRVTSNCLGALRQLRRTNEERTVWIDSVSINQGNTNERNYQVSMMKEIYERAATVDNCIQTSGRDYSGALELLERNSSRKAEIEKLQPSEFAKNSNVVQLAALFHLRYFSRAWVIQEVFCAETIYLHVDSGTVPFSRPILETLNDLYASKESTVPRLAQWLSGWRKRSSIIALLNITMRAGAFDPRNKVFSTISLLPRHN